VTTPSGAALNPEWDIDVEGDFEPLVDAETFHAAEAVIQG
jgi:hypothetical protein